MGLLLKHTSLDGFKIQESERYSSQPSEVPLTGEYGEINHTHNRTINCPRERRYITEHKELESKHNIHIIAGTKLTQRPTS